MGQTDQTIQLGRWGRVPDLSRLIARLRWVVPLIVLLLAAGHQVVVHRLLDLLAPDSHSLIELAIYSFTGSLVAWLGLTWIARAVSRQEQAQVELQAAYENLKSMHQQLLAVHEIGRQVASAADVQEVLELAARAPVYLARAKGSAVVSFDENNDRLKLEMTWGLSDGYVHALRRRVEEGIPAGRCRGCTPLQARVTGDCPLFQGLQDLAQAEGIASLICLPIAREQVREGIISAYFSSPDGPSEGQIRFLNIVATEIAAALEGVRLRTQQMAAFYTVENLTRLQENLSDLLEQVLETTLAGWGAESGAILLYDKETATWHHWAQRGLGDGPGHPHFGLAIRLAEQARRTGQAILVPDLAKHESSDSNITHGLASAAAAPLMAGGELLGALVMASSRRRAFQPRHAPFFSAIAHQAALAISNAQLHAQVQQMAILEERYRLSREMHDGLAQTLSSIGWQLDHLKMLLGKGELKTLEWELTDSRQAVREAYMDVREAIDGLRLAVDHPGGLVAALAEYVADFEKRTGIVTHFQADDELLPLSPPTELQLLRIVQEGLTNVRKHAGAHHAWVRLQATSHGVELVIADDGQGFDPHLPRDRHHLGLASMRERAQSLGGSFTLATSPGQGTRLTVTVPCEPMPTPQSANGQPATSAPEDVRL